jgi:pimeloyl-ACP methyl ester carboxylesterase
MTNPRRTASRPAGFTELFAKVNGVRLRYLVGGHGSAVILLHGYAETGRMWRPIMPVLAERHTVVVPDLRGAGGLGQAGLRLRQEDHGRGHPRAGQIARA